MVTGGLESCPKIISLLFNIILSNGAVASGSYPSYNTISLMQIKLLSYPVYLSMPVSEHNLYTSELFYQRSLAQPTTVVNSSVAKLFGLRF